MKAPSRAAVAAALLLLAVCLVAQERSESSFRSRHYSVQTDLGQEAARQIAERLEAATVLYNEFLHFDPERLPSPLRVRIFAAKTDYDAYLTGLIDETREDFVYISYSDASRSELVGFARPLAEFEASGLHYGFIQFLSAYVPSAPLWLAEGIATYLEYSAFDPSAAAAAPAAPAGAYRFRPNYAWLDSLKGILRDERRRIPLTELLLIGKEDAQRRIEAFYPLAWGLVHFLKNSPERSYNRVLWEAIAALEPSFDLEQNSRRVSERAFAWVPSERLEQDFVDFILGLTTFNDRVRQGVEEYAAGRLLEAEVSFREALVLREDSYIPHYYLGLILYQRRAYAEAAEQYLRARELGVEAALVSYALGVNAFAAQQYDEAVQFLKEAKAADPVAYGAKVDTLLGRIEVLR